MATKYFMTTSDGMRWLPTNQKSITLDQYPDDAWNWYSGEPGTDTELYDLVAFLYRAIQMDAAAVSTMPFQILTRSGDVYDDSSDWQNKLGYLKHPRRTIALVRMSLLLFGRAYLLPERNRAGVVKSLRYLAPTTIEPKLDVMDGLVGWKRNLGTRTLEYKPEDIIYFWLADPRVELGPPQTYPYKVASTAAGLLFAQDKFITEFMRRGGVPPTLLGMKGMPSDTERERIERWWNKFIRGAFDTIAKVFNSEAITITQVGQGINQLDGLTLTEDKRQDIAAALGIPLSLLLANSANYATAINEYRAWYDNTIVPGCEFIAEVLNEQLLEREKLTMNYIPETLDVYQADEQERAQAFSIYAQHMPASIAAQVVGVELPPGIEYESLDGDEPEPEPEPEPEEAPEPEPEEEPEPVRALSLAAIRDLEIWQRKAKKAAGAGAAQPVFTTTAIPGDVYENIAGQLAGHPGADGVEAIFAGVTGYGAPDVVVEPDSGQEVKAILEAIRLAVEALRAEEARSDGIHND